MGYGRRKSKGSTFRTGRYISSAQLCDGGIDRTSNHVCANFIAISISCAVPITTGLQVMSKDEKAYIGARWQFDLSRAIWKIASNVIRTYTAEDIANARKAAS